MRVVGEPEAAAGNVGLAICRRVKVLRLHGGVRRNGRYWVRNAIAGLGTAPEALGVELGLQTVAGKGDAVCRHPMLRIGERAGEIERPRIRFRIDARLKGIAAPAAEPLRKAPSGPAARERKADDGPWRKAIIQTGRAACRLCGKIMTADHKGIAAGTVRAAIARTPYAPALLERKCLVDRCAQHLAIGERNVFRQRFAIGCEPGYAPIDAANTGAAIHERIGHSPDRNPQIWKPIDNRGEARGAMS